MQAHDPVGGHQVTIRREMRLALWMAAWAATLALATFGPRYLWESNEVASWAAVAVNFAVGIGAIVANARFLREIDELQRKIMLDAVAVTLGVGWIVGFAYVAASNADLIGGDPDVGTIFTLQGVVYMIAVVVSNLRYR